MPSTSSAPKETSNQAAALNNSSPLGYTPFEYWKGPKPVIPGSKRTPGPITTRRATTIAVTAVDTSSGPKAQQLSIAVAALFPVDQPEPYREKDASYRTEKMGWTDTYNGDRTAGPTSFQVHDHNGSVELVSGLPPSYSNTALPPRDMKSQSRWDPRGWRKRTWAGIALVVIVAIVAGVVAGVLVAKANRYPDYSKLTYSLEDTYSGTDFFDNFDYYEGYDPSSGFVHYVPQARAEQLNLTYASSSTAVLKVDTSVGNTSSPDASTGRFSVRVTSKTQYDSGLFIFDVKHTPYGCGTWPALWLTDTTNWPDNGEIDVMEAVNQATDGNQMTLHTNDGCDVDVKRKMSGTAQYTDCNNATNSNAGCGVLGATSSYGSTFNSNGGGMMAMEWRDEGIRMWQFGRDSIPDDITNQSPDPSSWGTASADFPNTDCSISSHFKNQSIIANIDLCGSWAGNVYADSGCPSDCETYVANYPSAFTNAYWEFGAFYVYKSS
ncbi:endo-beta-glucanase [Seiridium cupressi]